MFELAVELDDANAMIKLGFIIILPNSGCELCSGNRIVWMRS